MVCAVSWKCSHIPGNIVVHEWKRKRCWNAMRRIINIQNCLCVIYGNNNSACVGKRTNRNNNQIILPHAHFACTNQLMFNCITIDTNLSDILKFLVCMGDAGGRSESDGD